MSDEPLKLQERQAAERCARWAAVGTVKTQELAAMTDDRALKMVRSLRPLSRVAPNPLNRMGLAEEQHNAN